jgi:hypothetical protein
MPSSAIRVRRRVKCLAFVVVVLVFAAVWMAVGYERGVCIARSSSGSLIKLERYAFRPGTVRYYLPNRPVASALMELIPEVVKNKIRWFQSEYEMTATAPFPNEPLLSAAFSERDTSGKLRLPGTRLRISDDRGQTFDSGLNYTVGGVFEVPAFPRRGKELRLHLMDGDISLAEFGIPNPCPGPHPVWEPRAMPATGTNATLEVTLESFVSDAAQHRTRCVFRVRENGRESTAWLPEAFEVSDATGNHWRPLVERCWLDPDGHVVGSFFGSLWPGEAAWKLRVKLKPAAGLEANAVGHAIEFLAKPQ